MAVSAAECQMEATAQLVESFDPAFVLALGDLQYEYGELDNFRASYDTTWGRFRSITRPVVGNHEYAGGRAPGYYGYWGEAAAPPNGWYAFDVAEVGWRVVVVNSVCSVVGCDEGSAQLAWLREQLASPPPCTAVAMHHPRYTSGLHGDDGSLDPVWRALLDGGVDIVLAGHDHHYERLVVEPDGPRQFIVGTGGRNLYPVIVRRADSEFVDARHFGILELDLSPTSYAWRFRAIDGGGVLDSGTADCR
jgi:acid phosphatase type 7